MLSASSSLTGRNLVAHFLLATLVVGWLPPLAAAGAGENPRLISAAAAAGVAEAELAVTSHRLTPLAGAAGREVDAPRLDPESISKLVSSTHPSLNSGPAIPASAAASLRRPPGASAPVPGIQKDPQKASGMRFQAVQPPRSPFDLVKHFPNEYAPPGTAWPPSAAGPKAKLQVRPRVLRFAQTPAGTLPPVQILALSAASRQGVDFEIEGAPDWLDVGARRGSAKFEPTAVEIGIRERFLNADSQRFEAELTVRNLGDPGDVRRVAVRLDVVDTLDEPLESRDEDGRLERLVRADGGILDYEYGERGQLTRIRYPDGTSVGYTYDDAGRRTSMVDGQGTTVYRYDEKGRLAAVDPPGFNPLRYNWDDEDRLTTITYPDGRVVSYSYDGKGNLAGVHEDAGTTVYDYDHRGRLLGQTLPNGIATEYGYDDGGRIVEVLHRDPADDLALGFRYTLDERGQATHVERETADGVEVTSFAYDEEGRIAEARYPDGRAVRYEYDGFGNRLRMIETLGADIAVTDYYYDTSGRLLQAGEETFEYDVHGNVVARYSPGWTLEYGYDFENRLIAFSDGEHRVAYDYDGDGHRIVSSIDGRIMRHGVDASGAVGAVLFDADEAGKILRSYAYGLERHSRGGATEDSDFFLYDRPLRNVAATGTAPGGLTDPHSYDVFGAPATPPDQPAFLFGASSYDPVTGLIDLPGGFYDPALGRFLNAGRDPSKSGYWRQHPEAHRPLPGSFSDRLAQAIGLSGTTEPTDPVAEPSADETPTEVVIFQSNQLPPPGLETKRRTASMPFPKLTQFERGTSYRRSAVGHKSTAGPRLRAQPETLVFADADGQTLPLIQDLRILGVGGAVSFSLTVDAPWIVIGSSSGTSDEMPFEIAVSLDSSALPAGAQAEGRITVINDADGDDRRVIAVTVLRAAEFLYHDLLSVDGYGRLQRVVRPDGSIIDFEHGPAGKALRRIRPSDAGEVSFDYDPQGRRTAMVDSRGETVYQYDHKGRLVATFPPGLNPIRYEYDNADRIEKIVYPDTSEFTYSYDVDGRIASVTGPLGTFGYLYDPTSGQLIEEQLPNGVRLTYSYDAAGLLAELAAVDGLSAVLERHIYTYDGLGLVSTYTQVQAGVSQTFTYTYDALRRLERVDVSDGSARQYAYDALGNMVSSTIISGGEVVESVDFEYDGNQLLRAGDEIFQHDALGRIVRRVSDSQETLYSYDSSDRLLSVTREGQSAVEYVYDGDGRRVSKTTPATGTTHFINGPSGTLLEADALYRVTRRYAYGERRLGFQHQGESYFFLSSGLRGDVSGVTTSAGTLAESLIYSPFGQPLGIGPSTLSPYGYASAERDAETGLIYFNARYYDPDLGRFLTPDPFKGLKADPQSFNPYAYSRNNPVNTTDASGEFWNFVAGAAIGVAGQYVADVAVNVVQGNGWSSFTSNLSSWQTYVAAGAIGAVNPGAAVQKSVAGSLARTSASATTRFIASHAAGGFTNGVAQGALTQGLEFGTGARSFQELSPGDLGINGLTGAVSSPISNFFFSGTGVKAELGRFGVETSIGVGSSLLFGGSSSASTINGPISKGSSSSFLTGGIEYNDFGSLGAFGTGGDLGGVDLNLTADLLLDINDLAGAAYDEKTGQLLLFGSEDVALPEMDLDDMAVAVNAVFSGEDPGVSIDPPIVNDQMSVRYVGPTAETEFGWIMYEADRVLKILILGKDNLTGQPVTSNVPGYQNMLSRRLATGCGGQPTSVRMYFQPKEVRLVRSADGRTMLFDAVSMELLHESTVGGQVVSDPQAAAFAQHFTDNYNLFAAEWPILRELERLGKIVGVIKWIKDNDLPIDVSFIDNYGILPFDTPDFTPAVSVEGTTVDGGVICTLTITGGVTYQPPNEYLNDDPEDPVTDLLRQELLTSRPSETEFAWTFTPPASLLGRVQGLKGGGLDAVAQSFARSRKDGNTRFARLDFDDPVAGELSLRLARWYDSFADRSGPFGRGWHVLPHELRFSVGRETFTFGSEAVVYDLYRRIWMADRPQAAEEVYELIGIDDQDLPLYLRSGAMDLLRQKPDGTYELTREDGGRQRFAADGRLLELLAPEGGSITYGYNPQGLLASIGAADGRAITLTYGGSGNVEQADGPGGRQVSYGYGPNGLLELVTLSAARTEQYGYDGGGLLVSVVGAEGNSLLDAAYDAYQRTPTRSHGTASFGFDFHLDERRTLVTNSAGSVTEQLYDEKYRVVEGIDPIGNRSALTYDGDFGPASVTDPQGDTTQVLYDSRGNLTEVVDDEGQPIELFYDYRDLVIAIRDAAGVETAFGYDEHRNLATIYHTVVLQQDPDGTLTSFLYDPNDVTELFYDSDGELVEAENPLDQTTIFARTAAGQVDAVTTAGGLVTDFDYDGRLRPTTIAAPHTAFTLAYDGDDNPISITNVSGGVAFAYDGNGRLTAVTEAGSSLKFTSVGTRFGYDADGFLTTVTDSADRVTTYSFDSLGSLLAAELPNGTRNLYAYDARGRPLAAAIGSGEPRPRLGLSVDTLDFGDVPLGQTAERTLELYSLSRTPVTVMAAATSAPFATDLVSAAEIQAGESLTLTVSYTPDSVQPEAGDLSITSNDVDQPVRLVALSGRGTVRVANLWATPAGQSILLTWDPFDPGAQIFDHFNVYRETDPIGDDIAGLSPIDSSLTDAAATSFVDATAVAGTRYYYAVTPVFAGAVEPTAVESAGPAAFFLGFGTLEPPFPVAASATDETRPAVAYSSVSDVYLTAFELDDGSGKTDIYGQRLATDGALLGSPFAIAASADSLRRPRLAYSPATDEFLVVFEFDFAGDGSNWVVYGQRVSANGLAQGGAFAVGGYVVDENNPEVVFNPTANEFFVVFDFDTNGDGSDLSVVGQRVTTAGTTAGPTFFINQVTIGGVSVDDRHGHLAVHPSRNEYLIASEIDIDDDGSNWDLIAARFAASSTTMQGFNSFGLLVGGVPRDDFDPHLALDSVHGEYLLTWQAVDDPASDLWAQKLDALGDFTGISGGLFSVATSGQAEQRPRSVFNPIAAEFVIFWDTAELAIDARRFQVTDSTLILGGVITIAPGITVQRRPDAAWNDSSLEMLVVWEAESLALAATGFDILARRLGNEAPVLEVAPAALDFGEIETMLTFDVDNSGTGTLDWFLVADQPWLFFAPGSGMISDSPSTVTVTVDRTDLAAGSYDGILSLSSNGGDVDVPVTMSVAGSPPDAPSDPVPADGAAGVLGAGGTPDVTLSWQGTDPDGDPLVYDVYFSEDPAPVQNLDPGARIAQDQSASSAAVNGLAFQTGYSWRVVARDGDGETAGPVWSFTTGSLGGPVLVPVSPDPTSDPRPTLAWNAVNGAASYRVQAAADAGFSALLIDATTAVTSHVPAADLPEAPIFWRVAGIDGGGLEGPFSAADDFTVDQTAPAVPTLIPVSPDPTADARPELAWIAVAEAAAYRLEVDDEAGFAAPQLIATTVGGTSFEPTSDFPEGVLYWRVSSRDAAGNASAFAASNFTIDLTAPPQIGGLAVERTQNGAELTWDPVVGPPADFDHYNVYRADASFSNVSGMVPFDTSITDPAATLFTDTTAQPGTEVHYAVTAVDELGNENRAVSSVVLPANLAPDSPTNPNPGDGALDQAAPELMIAWQASDPDSATLTYDVYLSTDEAEVGTLNLNVRIAAALDGASYTATGLSSATTYFWRVVVLDDQQASTPGDVWSFVTTGLSVPDPPVLVPLCPDPTSTLRPTLSWSAAPGASGYRFQLATAPDFAEPTVAYDVTTAETSFTPGSDLAEGTYYWRVASRNGAGNESGFSAAEELGIDLAAPGQADADGDGAADACDVCPGFDDGPDADGDGIPDGCDACPGAGLVLDDGDVVSAVVYEACTSITAGGGFHVLAGGDVTFRAGNGAVLGGGFSVSAGAIFRIEIDPELVPE